MKQKLDSKVRIAHDELDESVLSEGEHDQLQTLKRLPIPQAAPRELTIGTSQDIIVAEIEPEPTEDLHE